MNRLTIVVGYRERNLERVERCLSSLEKQTFKDFKMIFVDYGSSRSHALQIETLVGKYSFCHYIYSDTRGMPWNRSHALNTGIRLSQSKYVMTTDVDMIFSPNFLQAALEKAGEQCALHCSTYFLPKDFSDWEHIEAKKNEFPRSNNNGLGGCQILPASVYQKFQGFDEFYRYWGVEDRDLNRRIKSLGIEEVWLNDDAGMFHQWHPLSDYTSENFMPDGLWARAQVHFYRYLGVPVRNSENWGRVILPTERPVYRFIDPDLLTIKNSSLLVFFDETPDNDTSAGNFVARYWELPSGHALVVKHAFFPETSLWIKRVNKFIRYLDRRGGRLGWRSNRLHAFLVQFIEENGDLVADYFLGLPDMDGVSVIVKK